MVTIPLNNDRQRHLGSSLDGDTYGDDEGHSVRANEGMGRAPGRRGPYGNTSDYIRDLIRKDQERMGALAVLQTAITEGVTSGEPQPFDAAAFKLCMRERPVGQ